MLTLPPPSIDGAALAARIKKLEASVPLGRLGVAMKDLRSGVTWLYRGDTRFPMQSVFKLPLGVAVLRAVDRKEIALDGTITIRPKDLSVPMSLINEEVDARGRSYSIKKLLELTVGASDNTGADVLMERLGGPKRVHAELASVGVRGIRIDRYERDLQRESVGLGRFVSSMTTEEGFTAKLNQVPRNRRIAAMKRYLQDPRDTATPRGMMQFLTDLQAGKYLKAASHKLLIEIATKTTTGRNRLKAGLPKGSTLTHKTGTGRRIDGRAGAVNDAGIATLPNGRKLVIVAFLAGAGGTTAQRERVLAEVARAAVEAVR